MITVDKRKSKFRWEGWESSGREDWVFGVEHPRDLMGIHAKLIDKELNESEKIEHCLYSPRVSSISPPFGLKSEESSWGICVTDKRFIISQNRHIKGIEPRVVSIDFQDIMYCNIGSALLLSWFSITYLQDGQTKKLNILFSSNGKHHFAKAIRVYKKYCRPINTDDFVLDAPTPASFIHKVSDSIHRNYLKTLMSSGEKCILTFSCQYIWDKTLRRNSLFSKKQSTYLTSKATVLFTDKSLFIARNSLAFSIGNSVDIQLIPLEKVKSTFLLEEKIDDSMISKLRVDLVNNSVLDIRFLSIDEQVRIFLNNIGGLLESTKKEKY
jgi:hypothetical protein